MKKFLCTVAFMLVASLGFSNDFSKTNEGKPVKKAKIEAKSQKLVSTRFRVKCPSAQGSTVTYIECDCNMAQATAIAIAWCANQ